MSGVVELKQFVDLWAKSIERLGDLDHIVNTYLTLVDLNTHKLYELGAHEFLDYARQDLCEEPERGSVNALRNAKTSLECRLDELLTVYGLYSTASKKRWTVPDKLKALRGLGVTAPRALQRLVSSKRNVLEHEYRLPGNRDDVEDIVDVVELFLESTRENLENTIIEAEMKLVSEDEQRVEAVKAKFPDIVRDIGRPGRPFVLPRIPFTDIHRILLNFDKHNVLVMHRQRDTDNAQLSSVQLDEFGEEAVKDMMALLARSVSKNRCEVERSDRNWRELREDSLRDMTK
jgi:hypothetical protein